jgi:hypothetical protein
LIYLDKNEKILASAGLGGRPQLDQVREYFKSILQRGIHTAPIVKNNSPAKKDNFNKRQAAPQLLAAAAPLVPIIKHFPTSVRE